MRKLFGSRAAAAVGGAATALVLAGAGYAVADGSGVITACVHRHGGGLYVGRCARHDRKLRWNTVGQAGPQGPQGVAGSSGSPGPFLTTLPAGDTETGVYALNDPSGSSSFAASTTIQFPFPLASAPNAFYIPQGTTPPPQCPGTVNDPQATSGNLCVYEAVVFSAGTHTIVDPLTNTHPGSSRFGAIVAAFATNNGDPIEISGTWAVTG